MVLIVAKVGGDRRENEIFIHIVQKIVIVCSLRYGKLEEY